MIDIKITPGAYHANGRLTATGHAGAVKEGFDPVCCAVSALIDGLLANLGGIYGLKVLVRDGNGKLDLSWIQENRDGHAMEMANRSANWAKNALKALAERYPQNVRVVMEKPTAFTARRRDK